MTQHFIILNSNHALYLFRTIWFFLYNIFFMNLFLNNLLIFKFILDTKLIIFLMLIYYSFTKIIVNCLNNFVLIILNLKIYFISHITYLFHNECSVY